MPATSKKPSDGRIFAQELSRAVAQRGRLDPVYQVLSDHWTLILQRMFPVWSVVGPKVASPGHIELTSRTVYLDSDELLGTRQEILAGTLDPQKVLATFGVGIHEVLHAKHTKLWISERDAELAASEDPADRQLAEDRNLLEEPRMEANGVREFPDTTRRGKFVRRALNGAVIDVILPRFIDAVMAEVMSTQTVSRDLCGRSMVYLQARTYYGACDGSRLGPLPALWEQVLGTADVALLNDLFARLIWAKDGDNDALDHYAKEYRDIIGDPPPPPAGGAAGDSQPGGGSGAPGAPGEPGEPGEPADGEGEEGQGDGQADGQGGGEAGDGDPADGDGSAKGDGSGPNTRDGDPTGKGNSQGDVQDGNDGPGTPDPQSLADALKDAQAEQRDGILQQLNEDIDLQSLLQNATKPDPNAKNGRGTGAPTGRLPDRGVNRPPMADEVQMARQYARRMHKAREVGLRKIDKRTPGGTFNGRTHMRAHAQRSAGVPVTAHPWEITKVITAPLQEPHVAIVIDTSGSMGGYEYALGPIAWVITAGLKDFGGQCAISLFGNGCELMTDGKDQMRLVPGIKTGGGTAFGGDAIALATDCLDMQNPKRPRFAYCISDGGFYDTEAGLMKIAELRSWGVPLIHISIGCEPLSIDADRISVIQDPAQAMDIIANDTVEALKARGRR